MVPSTHSTSGSPPPPTEPLPDAPWSALIPEEQWVVFREGTTAFQTTGTRFLLGGALALAAYTQHWRNTKDIDVIVRVGEHEAAIEALKRAGFEDYYPQEAYDRSWIFRGFKNGVIFDVIWELPNHRVMVDDEWFDRACVVRLDGIAYAVVPPEELVRIKLYVMQRNRCDWVDVLNVLAGAVGQIDWPWLLTRMGRDVELLHAVLALFNWMCPGRAREIPEALRKQFALPAIEADDATIEERRTRLLDSRPWFALHQPTDRPLEL